MSKVSFSDQLSAELVQAVLRRDAKEAEKLLSAGAQPHAARGDKPSAFSYALKLSDRMMLDLFLARGASAGFQAVPGVSVPPLAVAMQCDLADLSTWRTTLLIERGARADVTFTYNGEAGVALTVMLDDWAPHALPPEEKVIADMRAILQRAAAHAAENACKGQAHLQRLRKKAAGQLKL